VEKKKRQKVKFLRSGNEGKYTSMEFKEYLGSESIEHQLSILVWPKQNRVAERMNWTLIERARSIRLHVDMSEVFWEEVVSHSSYLVNKLSFIDVDLQIPEEIRKGESVDYSIL